MTDRATELRKLLEGTNRNLLSLLTHPDRRDAGALSNFITYSRRLGDKLVNFAGLGALESRRERVEDEVP